MPLSKGDFMKKIYEKAEIKITVFDNDEVLAASTVFDDEGRVELPFVPAN